MNSMIRQHHLRLNDIKAFLRAFERNKPLSPDEWASHESSSYEPGQLVFCLEAVAAPAGLSSFSKRGEDQGETFRVKYFAVIVSKEDGKCMVVNVSASAYELRLLDSLLLELAMKAILDGRDFNFLAARPVQKLDPEQVKALYKYGSEYSKGGSRRSLTADSSTILEPALGMLGQLGAKLGPQLGKQLLDITSICHMIFTPEGRQEDKNKTLLKSCFVPMRSEEEPSGAAPGTAGTKDQPLYVVDPMADVARMSESYSSDAGNIDLSHLAPEPPAPPAEAAIEPSSSFGDFGGLVAALAPQEGAPQAPPPPPSPPGVPFEGSTDHGRPPEMPTVPPPPPTITAPSTASYTNLAGVPQQKPPGTASYSNLAVPPHQQGAPGTASYANLAAAGAAMPGNGQGHVAAAEWFVMAHTAGQAGRPQGGPGASQTNLSPFPQAGPSASQTNLSPPPQVAPNVSQTNLNPPPQVAPNVSQTNLNPPPQVAPNVSQTNLTPPPQAAPTVSRTNLTPPPQAAASTSQTNLTPPAQAEATAPEPPKEDYSRQFLNDWQQGHVGSAAQEAAEKEFERERQLKSERERGKEQRLREYFGEEHYQKYVKGEISGPELEKINAWQLDPAQYRSEPAEQGPNFDADIFANAGRSTLETNPDAVVLEPPREEITGPPPDPSWAIPPILDTSPKKADSSFENMLSAGGQLPVPEKVKSLQEPPADQPPVVPNLSILEGLTGAAAQSGEAPPEVEAKELGPLGVPAEEPAPANSLFDRLTGELSKDQQASAQTSSRTNLSAVDQTNADSEPAPTTINWAPSAAGEADYSNMITSGANWPSIPPSESLYAEPLEVEVSPVDEPLLQSEAPEPAASEPAAQDPGTGRWARPSETAAAEPAEQTAAAALEVAPPPEPVIAGAVPTEATMPQPIEQLAVDAPAQELAPSPALSVEPPAPELPAFEASPAPALTGQDPNRYSFPDASPEAAAEAQAEAAAQAAASEGAASESATSEGAAESQPARVRPRDYSSPLRAPKPLSSADHSSPLKPAHSAGKQNMPSHSLQSGQLPVLEPPVFDEAAAAASAQVAPPPPVPEPWASAPVQEPQPTATAEPPQAGPTLASQAAPEAAAEWGQPVQSMAADLSQATEPADELAQPAVSPEPAAMETEPVVAAPATEPALLAEPASAPEPAALALETPDLAAASVESPWSGTATPTQTPASTGAPAATEPPASTGAPAATEPPASTEPPAPVWAPAQTAAPTGFSPAPAPQATQESPATFPLAPSSSETAAPPLPFRARPDHPAGGPASELVAQSSQPAASSMSTGSQDARLMMNEMASLMSKLDTQVAKAANKMASRAEELRSRLSQQVDALVKQAQDLERTAEANLVTLSAEHKAKLDTLATEVQTSLIKEGRSSQQSIDALAQEGLEQLEGEQTQLSVEINRATEAFRRDLAKLTSQVTGRLDSLIDMRNEELLSLSDLIMSQLRETHDAYVSTVNQRFDRFEQRMSDETASISASLERAMKSMVEEIETSMERAQEKLAETRSELEQTVAHTIAVSETAIAQKAKQLLTDTILPRLSEQKEIIRTMITDMSKQIASESTVSLDAEVAKLDMATNTTSEKLRKIAQESIDEVESTGRSIKSGLEDHFKRTSSDLMVRTREVGDKIRETERRMAESENALKGLAESSTVDSEPELNEERNHAVSKLASLKLEASKQLANSIEQNLEGLDTKGEELISELSSRRNELTSQVRDASESNIYKIRQALQEATNAIRNAQERHME